MYRTTPTDPACPPSALWQHKQADSAFLLSTFNAWKAGQGRRYGSAEEEKQRLAAFTANMLDMARLNGDPSKSYWVSGTVGGRQGCNLRLLYALVL